MSVYQALSVNVANFYENFENARRTAYNLYMASVNSQDNLADNYAAELSDSLTKLTIDLVDLKKKVNKAKN